MIRPYLNGFTIAFNVSKRSTWQPYVDSMHHFLAGGCWGAMGQSTSGRLTSPAWKGRIREVVSGASVGGNFLIQVGLPFM